jgi:GNAT superfamily N-acetyltransferase
LEPERMGWVAELYGRADPKYRRQDLLEHLYTKSPAGPGLHAFTLDDGRPVGHCSVIPMRARRDGRELGCGKLEALLLDEPYRGVRIDGRTVARTLLDRLYAFADEQGIELLHAYATPRIGRVIAFEPLAGAGERSLVAVLRPDRLASSRARSTAQALASGQSVIRSAARIVARGASDPEVRPAGAEDVDLVEGPPAPAGRWSIVAEDAWDWYRASPLVRVFELRGAHGCRALIQIGGSPGEPVRLIGRRAARGGVREAMHLLTALVRFARDTGATSLRFQPWDSPAADATLRRACRLLGFVPRDDFTTLWVRTSDPKLARADAVLPTPLLYLGL